jgi:hypothetical protein
LLEMPLEKAFRPMARFAAAKKVGKESSYPHPEHFMPAAAQAIG